MKILYGITNNNICTVAQYIEDWKKGLPEDRKARLVTQILGFEDDTLKSGIKVLLVPSTSVFTKNLTLINKANAVVFVFDAAVRCEYLQPIQMLDVQSKTSSYSYTFRAIDSTYIIEKLRTGLVLSNELEISTNTVKVIPAMLDQVRGRSLMQPILTYLYKIPDTDKRYQYQAIILKWLVSTDSLAELKKQLPDHSQPQTLALIKCLETPPGVEGRQAVNEVLELRKAGKAVIYDKLAKKYPNIDTFDVRYILRTYQRIQSFQVENTELKQIFLQRKLKDENENHKVH